jgi:serine/threonine protein phosphatase PrpC
VPLRAFGLTDKGRVRPTNEDCFAIHEELGLCVIADGMGGHNAGEVAARLAVDAVVAFVRDPAERHPFGSDPALSVDGNLLRSAIHRANVQIREAALTSLDLAGMGTTVVAARERDGRLSVAHVGDSRLYLLAQGQLRQVTQDDSWMASMLAHDPDADPLLLQYHPLRNVLTNVVGARLKPDVHVAEATLTAGDLLLLSTDGVHGVLDHERLGRLMLEEQNLEAMTGAVISAALARGSRDNCTAVVARYEALS